MRRLFSWRSLRTRIALALVGLTLALGITALWHAFGDLKSILEESLQRRGVSIARDLASRGASPALINDVFGLFELVNDSLINNEDVRYIYIQEPSGEIRVHTFPQGLPPGLDTANPLQSGARQQLRTLDTNEGPVMDIAVPLPLSESGAVHVGMSKATVHGQLNAYIEYLSWLVLAACMAALTISFWLAKVLTRPLTQLVEQVKTVGYGHYDTKVPVDGTEELADLAVAFNAMTDALNKHRQDLVERNSELEILNSMADNLSRQLTPTQVLNTSLAKLLSLTGLPVGWVCLKGARGDLTLAAAQGVLPQPEMHVSDPERDGCTCRQVLEKDEGTILDLPEGCPLLCGQPEHLTSRVALPLRSRNGVLGVLNVASDGSHGLNVGWMRLLTSVGQQIGVAIENARLYEELQHKEEARGQLLDKLIVAQEEERKRIAREIHDEPTQVLTGVIMQLDKIGRHLPTDLAAVRQDVEHTRQAVRSAVETLHQIMTELRPQALDDLGFLPAIRWYAERRFPEQGVTFDLEVRGSPDRLDPQLETALFRMLQEAVNNVCRHAGARHVMVQLAFEGDRLRGQVTDDGRGFAVEAVQLAPGEVQGLGLLGMQERVALFGGTLSICSQPGQGTRVFFEVPLRGGNVRRDGENLRATGR